MERDSSPAQLEAAVKKVGVMATDVERELKAEERGSGPALLLVSDPRKIVLKTKSKANRNQMSHAAKTSAGADETALF